MTGRRRRDQRGLVLPTSALVASICAVAVAAVGFVLTSDPHEQSAPRAASVQTPTASPSTAPAHPKPKHHAAHEPAVHKKSTYVEVFNNSNVHGLAGRTAARAQAAGWNVVGSDNWYGTVEASTVYFPQRLRVAAHALARDLGIPRMKPAIAPMKLDRLTVILTADYSG